MRLWAAAAALYLLAACGGRSPEGDERSKDLVTQGPPPAASRTVPPVPALEPIAQDEIEQADLLGAGCDFRLGEQILLAAAEGGAIVRIRGRIERLHHEGPLEPSGGFFASRNVRVSVGRLPGEAQSVGETVSWPARIAVTTPRNGAPLRIEGRWSCGA